MDKMQKRTKKSSTSSSGGSATVHRFDLEIVVGVMSMVMATAAQGIGRDIVIWNAAVAGSAGIFGAFAFLNTLKFEVNVDRLVAILVGGGMGSIFGPILANMAGWYLEWLGEVNYFVDAAGGALVGLVSTPIVGFLRNPGPGVMFLFNMVVGWFGKK